MKSWHYIVIFIVFVAIVSGAIIYNAREINDIETEVTQAQSQKAAVQVKQEKIDVLNDADFESDALDEEMTDDMSDFDAIDNLVDETVVSF